MEKREVPHMVVLALPVVFAAGMCFAAMGLVVTAIACYAMSLAPITWVVISEIFPNRIRGRATSIAVLVNWSTNALSAFLFPWYVKNFGMYTGFFTFAVICLGATVFFWKFVPETRGKTLEEIEKGWERER